jgi:hypothetical protein
MPLAGNVPVGRVTDDLRSAVLAKPMLEGRIDFQDATAAEAPRDDAYRRRPVHAEASRRPAADRRQLQRPTKIELWPDSRAID